MTYFYNFEFQCAPRHCVDDARWKNTTFNLYQKEMRILTRLLLSCSFAAGAIASASAAPSLVINEIMQSNIDCIMDDLNEFPDSWVELYNTGNVSENLGDYAIGLKDKPNKAYKLPNKSIPAGGHLIIYCDKADRDLHTDFRLESGKGGAVYLFKGDEIVDQIVDLKKQPAPNIAYGRETDNTDKWGYMATPTPGEANCGRICKDVLPDPIFSVPGRVTSETLEVALLLPEGAPEGAEIRYTTNGKEPTKTSSKYTVPLRIAASKTVRAKIYCDGYLTPQSVTQSYIHHNRDVTLPVVSMTTNRDYFYNSKLGIYVEGDYTPGTPNYEYDWRRPVNIEYFEGPEVESSFNQLCETRVKGGATRGSALKSLAVYANKRFGTNRFNYEFFPDQTPGIAEFKSFEMRNSGNDFDYMYMRDAVIQQSVGMHCDLDWQPSRPVIFYINGEYKGILNIRPRSNEDYVYSYYDGLEDIDMYENWEELKTGDDTNFKAFTEFYKGQGHSLEEFDSWMDTSEFCNLMIMGNFYDNKDFPGNNIVMWRPIDGGRWRWISKDTDFGMGLYGERYDYPTLNWMTTPGYDNNRNAWANNAEHTRLFRRLMVNEDFKNMFIERAAVYMGDFLTPDEIISLIDARYEELKFEYKFHRDLFNPWWPNYSQEIANARTWTKNRWTFFYKHLASFFGLSNPVPLYVDKGTDNGRTLTVNGIQLSGSQFNGKYFPGRTLTISSDSETDGQYINGWEVTINDKTGTHRTTYKKEVLTLTMPEASSVSITSILGSEPLAVESLPSAADSEDCIYYDTSGRRVLNPSKGIFIRKTGSRSEKIIF